MEAMDKISLFWSRRVRWYVGKDVLIIGKGPTQGLDDTTLRAEAKYQESGKKIDTFRKKICLHYTIMENTLKLNIIHCLGNVSKDFAINNMRRTVLKEGVKFFPVGFNPIDTNNILDVHKYLMKGAWFKIMFGLIKKYIYWIINWSS